MKNTSDTGQSLVEILVSITLLCGLGLSLMGLLNNSLVFERKRRLKANILDQKNCQLLLVEQTSAKELCRLLSYPHGYVLLELLFSIFLSSLIMAAATASFTLASHQFLRQRLSLQSSDLIESCFLAVEKGVRELPAMYRLVPLAVQTLKTPQSLGGSSVLTFYDTDLEKSLRVKSGIWSSQGAQVVLCDTGIQAPDPRISHWLAFGADRMLVVSGKLKRMSGQKCLFGAFRANLQLNYRATDTLGTLGYYFESPSKAQIPQTSIHLIAPLNDFYQIYLKPDGTLQRLSLLTKEHQPLAHGIQDFRATLQSRDYAYLLTVTITTGGKRYSRGYLLPITRSPLLNLIQ